MNLNNNSTCYDCKYYTDSIGENGYCTFYRHNISVPEVQCSKFEEKESLISKEQYFDFKGAMHDIQQSIKADRKEALKQLLLSASICSCLVFTVIAIIFSSIVSTAILSFDAVALTMKVVFIITVCFFLLSLLLISFMLVHRFTVMRIVYFVASLICVIFMSLNESLLWFNFHDMVVGLLEEIFNIVF